MTDEQKTDNIDYIKQVFDVATNRSSNAMGIAPDTAPEPIGSVNAELQKTVETNTATNIATEEAEPEKRSSGIFSRLFSRVKKLFGDDSDDSSIKSIATSAISKLDANNGAQLSNIPTTILENSSILSTLQTASNDVMPANLPSNVTSINSQLVEKTQAYTSQQSVSPETKVHITIDGSSAGSQSDDDFARKVEAAVQRAMKKHQDSIERKQHASSYDIRIS